MYARELVLMHGKNALVGAGKLYLIAASFEPREAMDPSDVKVAGAKLA